MSTAHQAELFQKIRLKPGMTELAQLLLTSERSRWVPCDPVRRRDARSLAQVGTQVGNQLHHRKG